MTPLERVEASLGALKVFPLPSAVLFPHAALPLHVFEPRYRELVRDCLTGDRVMALAQLQPGWEANYYGRPPLERVCCAGVLAWHEALPDGTFNVLLQGAVRVELLQELPPRRAYRELRARVLPEKAYSGPEEELLRQAVLELASHTPPQVGEKLVQLVARASGGVLADGVASALVAEPVRRQRILSELDVKARLSAVLGELGEVMARLGAVRPPGLVN